jgi:predicted protein tyrosine phosphatase
MIIHVSPLSRFRQMVSAHSPARIVSLLDPTDDWPSAQGFARDRHLKVGVHDITAAEVGFDAPGEHHVERIIDFLGGWDPKDTLYVHCWAGISRSSATAFIAGCLANPDADERRIANAIREASPLAQPNTRLVQLADNAMGRKGRMADAVALMEPGRPYQGVENRPFSIPSIFVAD